MEQTVGINCLHHKQCYLKWRDLERRFAQGTDINSWVDKEIEAKAKYWRDLLNRILSISLFLGERRLSQECQTQLETAVTVIFLKLLNCVPNMIQLFRIV